MVRDAVKGVGALFWIHHDHLGSLVAASDANGNELCSVRYWPFGGLRVLTGTLPTDRLFTGQTRDLHNDSFYFFKARYYDAAIGKFQTADSVVPDPKRPAALNRYAYGLNNPLRLVDPSGHFTQEQLRALGYTQAQIDAWDKNDPEWAAIVAAARPGDVVTRLDPFTSGSPLRAFGTFTILPGNTPAQPAQLVLVGNLGSPTLSDFGRSVQGPVLWRPAGVPGQGTAIGPPLSSEEVQTPHLFLSAGQPDVIGPQPPNALGSGARALRQVAGVLDPTSFGPLTPNDAFASIGLRSFYEVVLQRAAPRLVTDADVFALATEGGAFLYDRIYDLLDGGS